MKQKLMSILDEVLTIPVQVRILRHCLEKQKNRILSGLCIPDFRLDMRI